MAERCNSLDELVERLLQHPEVKKALARTKAKTPKAKKKRKPAARRSSARTAADAPPLLRQAMALDPRVEGVATSTRNLSTYLRELNALLKARARGGATAPDDSAFAERWGGIEEDYRTVAADTAAIFRESPVLMAATKALAEMPQDFNVFANPVFLDPRVMAVAEHLGMSTEDMALYFENAYLPSRELAVARLDSIDFDEDLEDTDVARAEIAFQLSPDWLVQGGVLTIGGDWGFLGNLFGQLLSALTTIVHAAIGAALGAAAAMRVVPVASAAMVTSNPLCKAQKWVCVHLKPPRQSGDTPPLPLPSPPCRDCNGAQGPASKARSTLSVEPAPPDGQSSGTAVQITFVAKDDGGCCVPGAQVDLQAALDLSGGRVYQPLDWRSKGGTYSAKWGPATFSGVHTTLWVRAFVKGVLFAERQIEVTSNDSTTFSQLQDTRIVSDWVSITKARPPEASAALYGNVIGNSRRKKLHLPNCGSLYRLSPDHLVRLDTLEAGRARGMANCGHCLRHASGG